MANGLFNLKQVVQAVQQGGWSAQKPPAVKYLVVAGGGGGGASGGGGGGAGGLLTGTDPVPNGQTLLVTIGGGGVQSNVYGVAGTNGQNSVFGNLAASGGGGGAGYNNVALSGGSGGGGTAGGFGGNLSLYRAAQGTFGQGNAGGNGETTPTNGGGGGGGAGSVGVTPDAGGGAGGGGNGGAGIASAISGTVTAYAGGGGGGGGGVGGTGGVGGGGNGGYGGAGVPTAGAPNTGGGGGADWNTISTAGIGGTGIVIVSYPDTYAAPIATTGSPTVSTSGAGSLFPNAAGTLQSQNFAPTQSGDFTLECWLNTSATGSYRVFAGTSSGSNYVGLYTGNIVINSSTSGTEKQIPLLAGAPTINTWFHYCIMRSGSTLYGFINGVYQGVVTFTDPLFAAGYLQVCGYTATYQFPGYVSNLRLTNTLVYSLAGFTVPTSPLTTVTGTALLMNTASGAPYLDSSSNATTFFTSSGTQPLWNQESPFATGAGYKNRVYKWTSSGSITF